MKANTEFGTLPFASRTLIRYRKCRILMFVSLLGSNTTAQPIDSNPHFDVASLKESVDRTPGARPPDLSNPGRVEIHHMTLRNLILTAYEVNTYELQGPEWLQTPKYDILATMPVGTTREQMHVMLRSLLIERLGVVAHFAQQPTPVYALVIAKSGLRMPAVDRSAESGSESKMATADTWRLTGKISIDGLAHSFSSTLDRPLINRTGLNGIYDITFEFTPPGVREGSRSGSGEANADQAATPVMDYASKLFAAFEKQLGLKVERQFSGVKMLIVDHAERVPIVH